MSALAHLLLDILRGCKRACAKQLAIRTERDISEVWSALVQLHDLGLAYCQQTMSYVPRIGRARYWMAA